MRLNRSRFPWLLVAIVVSGPVTASQAGVIEYSTVLDTVTQFHDDFIPGLTINTVRLEASGGPPALTANFQTDKQLRVTYSAPAGQHFVFTPPADADSVGFTLWLGSLSAIAYGNDHWEQGVSIEFAGVEGTPPVESIFRMAYGGLAFPGPDDDFVASFHGDMGGGAFAFQSVTALFDVPAGYDRVFNSLDPVVSLSALALWNSDHENPGPWLSIEPVDVPEPASALLLLAGGWAVFRRRRPS
ncbi:MAG TPA: PEP-CTERM sorting domain-containing protein [Vicinamibacterales bacterium]|nr:PEP-CTERM sorting domain-containing protein [Vicinamibacterales bacterium]